jgi:zinc transporter ZupT
MNFRFCHNYYKFFKSKNSTLGVLMINILEVTPIQIAKILEREFKIMSNGESIEKKLILETKKSYELHKDAKINVEPLPSLNTSGRPTNNEEVAEVHLIENEEKEENEKEHEHEHHHGKKGGITPYILLLALGFHGFFEGMALGIQGEVRNTLFLALAIAAHKWAASLTLGISIIKAQISLKQLVIMILIFGLIGPVGIAFGMILKATANEIVEGIFLAISVGTFLYIACTEVLVEEFENSENKYLKFLAFMVGGIFTAGLSLIEKFTGFED